MKRSSGVLMHISSLFGDHSIGSFGKEAKRFADFLAECGFTYWQVLPFCMTDEANSPYKSYSAFGGNPFFIDLPTLLLEGLITEDELNESKQKTPYQCEYTRLVNERITLLARAAKRVEHKEALRIEEYMKAHPYLSDAATFLALKDKNRGTPWMEWRSDIPDDDTLFLYKFIQYKFFTQWQEVKDYANSVGIKIIGDVPIYVSHDSADVYFNKDQFLLDKNGNPSKVAGVPPDYFSEDGQLWGNPLYNWKQMKKDGYSWWKARLMHMMSMFDGIRIDHFRGLESYWSIPADAKTAKDGCWEKGPGKSFIDEIKKITKDKLVIAEDLGDITPKVEALVDYSGFPGMRVFQFAFLGDENTPHLPHNYKRNCVAYTGTHDNNTLLGHIFEMPEDNRNKMLDYCNCKRENWEGGCENIIKTMLASHSDTVIFPIQDLLIYGADTRMNTPGTSESNWQYRITEEQLMSVPVSKFAYLNRLYGRKNDLSI